MAECLTGDGGAAYFVSRLINGDEAGKSCSWV